MHARGRAYVRFGIEHPEHYRIMFMGPAYATPEQWDDLLGTGVVRQPRRGDRGADPTPGRCRSGADALDAALHVWANIHGLTSLLVARPGMPWPELDGFIDEHLALCLRPHLTPEAAAALGGPTPPRTRRRSS